ncbi:hypothetical protein [Streptomyces sp. NPDC046832]|uniref:hypothetical protein n=1 Tax=Streptomyces sp. NPDC046832 TaxID=3155020 RepID=UPI0033D51413
MMRTDGFKGSNPHFRSCTLTSDGQYRVVMWSPTGGEVIVHIPEVNVKQHLFLLHQRPIQLKMRQPSKADPVVMQRKADGRAQTFGGLLREAARLLPPAERGDWLEEQQGYLADLPSRRARWIWVLSQLAAMPRYAYTVHTGREKEPA